MFLLLSILNMRWNTIKIYHKLGAHNQDFKLWLFMWYYSENKQTKQTVNWAAVTSHTSNINHFIQLMNTYLLFLKITFFILIKKALPVRCFSELGPSHILKALSTFHTDKVINKKHGVQWEWAYFTLCRHRLLGVLNCVKFTHNLVKREHSATKATT